MKRVQKPGKDMGSTLGGILGAVLGFTTRLALDMISLFYVSRALSSIIVGYPIRYQVDIRETIVAVLYIILRLLGDLVQNRLTK
ncbi:hypothetical protein HWC09_gp151 [Lactobacillus phage 3-521]|uniref:Uncharacterized protein n=1 Tax=Lactobacillus phage 3-521 TaxID=2510943 RepID=A0A4Y5FGH7_9CAUD|nr:hypothetical protein HWC09_gp151 [Lactobacillus phage 3-521]QBJ03568.1 hypothetical protein UCC3521_0030 [Lactobacillus phage 3-521]